MELSSLEISFKRDTTIEQFGKQNLIQSSKMPILKNTFMFGNSVIAQRNKKQKKDDLKQIIKKAKVKKLTQNFAKKIRRNSIYRPVVDYLSSEQQKQLKHTSKLEKKFDDLERKPGIQLNNIALAIWSFANIIQITIMVFIFSVMLAFPETESNQIFLLFRVSSIVLYIVDMIFNFITQRYESGKKLQTLGQIGHFYLRNGFVIDLVSILIFPIDFFVDSNVTIFISFVAVIKLINNMNKFEKFEYLYINTSAKEQYYGLIKVFLTNFVIGHFLSIILNLMTEMSKTDNWVTKLQISDESWFVKYIWGYYWGTNIMLTVGFGDISATNYYQAIVLIFIETFSCITLAYNISYVGALIGSISEKNACKKKKMKTLHRMCKENEVSSEVEGKLSNFVEEFYRIKETFSYDDEDQVLEFLPKSMELEYRKESNRVLFDNLGFLSNMSKKTLLKLAESVSRKICHPEEIIIKKGGVSDFMIVQKGELGMACRTKSKLDGRIIQTIAADSAKPKIFSLDFIKNRTCSYNVKSLSYSVLYCLSREDFMNSLKSSEMDFQLFCVLRDRDEYLLDQNNLYQCEVCQKEYHNKFQCPRLHYLPLKQSLVFKSLQADKKRKNARAPHTRYSVEFPVLKMHRDTNEQQKEYIKNNFDPQQYKQMENLMQFYENKNLRQSNQQYSQSSKLSLNHFQYSNTIHNELSSPLQRAYLLMLQKIFQSKIVPNKFWDIQCDVAYNFRFYFSTNNSDNINRGKIKKKITIWD